ncbi:hypothetical protein CAEBREN_16138 [Caenorhabditis brenneri]|uniref:Uncharacterized protein n=1 Tax=Caenorhabditis brenneri TaxID=135651 RepID=G0NDY0_CAEBE|nr:hypothetical protein CAEBREN_16138 [Caenorhabditis brenneri]
MDKDSEIEDLKAQVQYWREKADLTLVEQLCRKSYWCSAKKNTSLKSTNEQLIGDLATGREENLKMKTEVAVAKNKIDEMETAVLEHTQQLKDVEKMHFGYIMLLYLLHTDVCDNNKGFVSSK